MGIMQNLFGGSSPTPYKLPGDPTLEGEQNELWNYDPGLSPFGRQIKQWGKTGADVSSLGYFNPLRQKEASDLAQNELQFKSGDNAMISGTGGEQANLVNASLQRGAEQIRRNTGMGIVSAMSDLMSNYEQERQSRINAELAAKTSVLGNRLGYYSHRYGVGNSSTGGIIPGLSSAATAAAGF